MQSPWFLNSALVKAPLALISTTRTRGNTKLRVRFGLWHHPLNGLVLIDTGYGPRVTNARGRSISLRLYSKAIGPALTHSDGAIGLLRDRGIDPQEIRNVIVTHFHADHVAALSDFPNAKIICSRGALRSLLGMPRFLQLHHGFFPELLPAWLEERIVDLDRIPRAQIHKNLDGADIFGDGTCFAVDLPGHAIGHIGVLWPGDRQPLLYGVDAAWVESDISEDPQTIFMESIISISRANSVAARRLLADFCAGGGRAVLCHEPTTYFGLED